MELWTFEHFITFVPSVIVMIIITIVLRIFLKNKSYEVRMIPFKILAVFILISEVIKQVLSFINGYNLYHIPLHVCSLFLFLIPTMAFYRGKGEQTIRTLTCMVCMSLALFMAIYPNLIYSADNIKNFFGNYFDFHTVFLHNIVILEFILIIGLNLHSINDRKYDKEVLFFASSYAVIAAVMAQILKTNFSNFYECNIGPVNELLNNVKESIGYAAGQIIYVVILLILHVAFFYASYKMYILIDKLSHKLLKN